MSHLLNSTVKNSPLFSKANDSQISPPSKTLNKTIHAAMHDVRSPLTAIKPYLDFLKKIEDSNKRNEILDRLKGSVSKIESIINGLVKYADLLCENTFELEIVSSENFKTTVQKEAALNRYDSTYKTNFKKIDSFSYQYPKGYFEEIIRIVLDNSFKYQSSERELNINLSLVQKNGNVLLQIEDNGQGIPESLDPQIACKAFSKNTNPSRGIGLGFPLIKTMIEKNGGSLDFSSSNKGSTVIIKMKSFETTENQILNFTNIKIGDQVDTKDQTM